VENGHVIITAITDAPLTLEQRLEHFDPTRHGGEIMAIKEVLGAEQW
jgi:antitoxin MazE